MSDTTADSRSPAPATRRQRPRPGDVLAGISVAAILVPQALAYAELAGMPPVTGLYAAALPPIVAAIWASSRYLQTGPVAMTALLTYGALSEIAEPGTTSYVQLAVFLALLVGVIRLVLGLAGGGAVSSYMSPAVVLGFSTAASLLIILSQLPSLAGVTVDGSSTLSDAFQTIRTVGDWNPEALAVGVATIVVTVVAPRIHPLVPGVLIAVIVGIILGNSDSYTAALVGTIPAGLPSLSVGFPWSDIGRLAIPAAVIAVVGFAEPTAIARTLAVRDRERWDPNRELIAQGAANIASGISGGFPVGGSFSRSFITRMAGAKTRWTGAVAGLAVLAVMPFVNIMETLPVAVLSGIVIAGVYKMLRLGEMVRLASMSWGQAGVAWGTAVATILLAPRIDLAVLLGVLAAAVLHLHRESSRIQVRTELVDDTLVLQPAGVLFYGSAADIENAFGRLLASEPGVHRVVIDLEQLGRIDHTGVTTLQEFAAEVTDAGLGVQVVNIPPHAAGIFERTGGIPTTFPEAGQEPVDALPDEDDVSADDDPDASRPG